MKVTTWRHCSTRSAKGPVMTRTSRHSAAILGATAKNEVTGVGAPSYTSGAHMWNGTAETLKHRPASTKTRPAMMPMLGFTGCSRPPENKLARVSNDVVPAKP